jgi:energy-coupling factor transporter ATP-binding protein EcfA2
MIIIITGPQASGKTTLANILAKCVNPPFVVSEWIPLEYPEDLCNLIYTINDGGIIPEWLKTPNLQVLRLDIQAFEKQLQESAPYSKVYRKAKKYDELDKLIGAFYEDIDEDEEGLDPEGGPSLIDIGEAAATHFGYM